MPDGMAWLALPDMLSTGVVLILVASAALTAALTSVLGAGGGLALILIMALWVPPVALIPVHGLVQFGANLNRAVLTRHHIRWPVIAVFAPGVLLGAWLASRVLIVVPEAWWQVTIAVFVLYLCWGPPLPARAFGRFGVFLASMVTTFISLFVGATGPLVGAFIKQMQSDRFQTVATFAAAMTLQHAPKAVAFGGLGFVLKDWLGLILLMVAATILGNRVGLRLLQGQSDRRFQRWFNLALTLLAARLLWQALVP